MKFTPNFIRSCALLALFGNSAWAENDQKNSQSDQSQNAQSQQASKESQAKYELQPAGWVQIAVDYNNDGMFDGIETIYAYDFEKARKSSQQRANREAQKTSGKNKDRGSQSSASMESVSGKVLQLRDQKIMGMDEPCVVARIRKGNNMPAKVVLGPKSKIDSWQLAEGDNITVEGRKGRVNDRPMLLASQVSWGDQTKQVDLPSSRNSKRVKAEIMELRTTQFKGHDGKFMVAKIQSQSGKKCEVNLGAKSKVGKLNLSEGDEIRMIVRPANMNGKPGMVADQIMAGGKTVNVSPPQKTARHHQNRSSENAMAKKSSNKRRSQSSDKSKSNSNQGDAALGIAVGETDEGVVIIGIHPQSPLAEKEMRVGDAIESINDQTIDSPQQLVSMISELKPGKKVSIVVNREGEKNTFNAKLTSRQKLMQAYR